MVGVSFTFTAWSIRTDFRKTGKPPEGNTRLMDLCTFYLVMFVGVSVCVSACVSLLCSALHHSPVLLTIELM